MKTNGPTREGGQSLYDNWVRHIHLLVTAHYGGKDWSSEGMKRAGIKKSTRLFKWWQSIRKKVTGTVEPQEREVWETEKEGTGSPYRLDRLNNRSRQGRRSVFWPVLLLLICWFTNVKVERCLDMFSFEIMIKINHVFKTTFWQIGYENTSVIGL